ncbi:MAG: hypothetical protein HKN68_11695 [Saprospiraceae bacterium]|nr:hypothetical protein [Saprospiraceae bacterium]
MRKFIWSAVCMLLVYNIYAQPEYDEAIKANKEFEKATTDLVDKYKKIANETGTLSKAYNWIQYHVNRSGYEKHLDKMNKLFSETTGSTYVWKNVSRRMYDAEIALELKYPDKYEEYKKQKWIPKELPKDVDVKIPDTVIKGDDPLHGMRSIKIDEFEPGGFTWHGTFTRVGTENNFTAVWTGGNLKKNVEEKGLTIVKFVPKKEIQIKRKAGTYTGSYINGKWKGTAGWYPPGKNWYWTAEIHMNQ